MDESRPKRANMAWKVIVSYIHGSLGGPRNGPKEPAGGGEDDDEDPAALSVSDYSVSSSIPSSMAAASNSNTLRRQRPPFWPAKLFKGGSLDSLDEEALSSPTSSTGSGSGSTLVRIHQLLLIGLAGGEVREHSP